MYNVHCTIMLFSHNLSYVKTKMPRIVHDWALAILPPLANLTLVAERLLEPLFLACLGSAWVMTDRRPNSNPISNSPTYDLHRDPIETLSTAMHVT